MVDLQLLHALVMLFHDHFFVPICRDISLVGGLFSSSLDFQLSLFGEGFFLLGFLLFFDL